MITLLSLTAVHLALFFTPLSPGVSTPCSASLGRPLQEPAAGTVKHNDKGNFDMVYIPACEFTMGSENNQWGWNWKPHQVTLSGYWIGKTPITVGQYKAYLKARHLPFDWHADVPIQGWRDDDPMVYVTWRDAQAYCRWAGGMLPTEAQWEHAARGPNDDSFPWGDTWEPKNVWISTVGDNRGFGAAPVNRTNHIYTNAFGCSDMLGNVREWCFDYWADSTAGDRQPATDPSGPKKAVYGGDPHCSRGFSWADYTAEKAGTAAKNMTTFTAYHRKYDSESMVANYMGFRFAQAARP